MFVRRTFPLALFLAALAAGPALAQTAQAPGRPLPAQALPAQAAPEDFSCRANLVRLWVSIPVGEHASPWFAPFWEPAVERGVTPSVRAACLELLDEPLVVFDQDPPSAAPAEPIS